MPYIIITILLLSMLFGPQLWAQYTFRRYAKPLDRIPGTGAELARHLLDQFEMSQVQVEKTGQEGDHYDPSSRTVRLSPDNYDKNSLTAVAVAAHEVGHAIQHHRGESMLQLRSQLVKLAVPVQKLGAGAILLMPVVTVITRAPSAGLLLIVLGIASMFMASIIHFVTLPVEMDASFGKALPILKRGNYIQAKDERAVKKILRAAALTYLAASLAGLLNLWRWIAILKR